jgi:DNA modification methylase
MKTLSLLLLASVYVMGQSELISTPNGNKILYHRGESFVLSDKEYAMMDFVVQSNIIQNSFLMYSDQLKIWFREYKRECYNDSFKVMVNSKGIIKPFGDRWQHETPTFEGFISWIEKRKQ